MGPFAATKSVFGNYVNMSGRASRSEYWWWGLTKILILCAFSAIAVLSLSPSWPPTVAILNAALFVGFIFGTFVPTLTVTVRRLHDSGRSGIWFFISLVPVIGAIWFLVLMVLPSQDETNEYGPHPTAGGSAPAPRKRATKSNIHDRSDVSNAYVAAFTTDPRQDMMRNSGVSAEDGMDFKQHRKAEISDYYKNKVLAGAKPQSPSAT